MLYHWPKQSYTKLHACTFDRWHVLTVGIWAMDLPRIFTELVLLEFQLAQLVPEACLYSAHEWHKLQNRLTAPSSFCHVPLRSARPQTLNSPTLISFPEKLAICLPHNNIMLQILLLQERMQKWKWLHTRYKIQQHNYVHVNINMYTCYNVSIL